MDFDSKVDIDNDRKIDILLSLMGSFRSQIMAWHDRAYVVATGSFGVLLLISKQWMDTENKTATSLIGYVVAIGFFSFLTQLYLRAAHGVYRGNEEGKLKCEYALRLKDEGAYFDGKRFFWREASERELGMPARDIRILRMSHAIASVFLMVGCVITVRLLD